MPNICCDTIAFYVDNISNSDILRKFEKDLDHCYSVSNCNRWIGILFEYLHISADHLHLRGELIHMEYQDDYIFLDVDAAWYPLYHAYKILAEYYGLHFVLQAEEPGADIYINTDVYGLYLPTRYRIFLKKNADAIGTLYEKLFKEHLQDELIHTEFYFSEEEELFLWFGAFGIVVSNLDELQQKLDSNYVQLYIYNVTCE